MWMAYTPQNKLRNLVVMMIWGEKYHISDCVLDTFPEHLKAKAKSMCDTLKCKDRLFKLPSHEILIDGEVDQGSNIRDYIMDSWIEPPLPGAPKFTMLEKENERLKRNLAYYEKALARAQCLSGCWKFESLSDGTVDCCAFSDDINYKWWRSWEWHWWKRR